MIWYRSDSSDSINTTNKKARINMRLSKTLFFALLAAVQQASVVAFVPPKASVATLPLATTSLKTPSRSFEPNALNDPRRSTSLSDVLSSLSEAPLDEDAKAALTFGWVVLCAAKTPYVLQLFYPRPMSSFVAIYYGGRDIEELRAQGKTAEQIEQIVESGRVAEKRWKVTYATLALAITTLALFEALGGVDAVRVVRDSYILWGIYYVYATWVIRRQALADPPIFKPESRTFVQATHIFVTVMLWASITETYTDTGKAIRDFVTNLFTFS